MTTKDSLRNFLRELLKFEVTENHEGDTLTCTKGMESIEIKFSKTESKE